jgi:hypothetical protein
VGSASLWNKVDMINLETVHLDYLSITGVHDASLLSPMNYGSDQSEENQKDEDDR